MASVMLIREAENKPERPPEVIMGAQAASPPCRTGANGSRPGELPDAVKVTILTAVEGAEGGG